MARGDNNILFNPPVIKRDKRGKALGEGGLFSAPVKEIWPDENFLLAYTTDDRSLLLDENLKGKSSPLAPGIVRQKALFSVLRGNVAYGSEHGGFLVTNLNDRNASSVFKEGLKGKALGLQLGRNYLYALWESGKETLTLSRISLKNEDDSTWEDVFQYQVDNKASFEKKEGSSILFYRDPLSKRDNLVTLHPDGPSGSLDISDSLIIPGKKHGRLIAPLKNRNEYFALSLKGGKENVMLFESKKKKDQALLGQALETEVLSLEETESTKWYEIVSQGEQALLLGNKDLLFFDKEGLIKAIPLASQNAGFYDRVSFYNQRAILWREGDASYQEILLPQ